MVHRRKSYERCQQNECHDLDNEIVNSDVEALLSENLIVSFIFMAIICAENKTENVLKEICKNIHSLQGKGFSCSF